MDIEGLPEWYQQECKDVNKLHTFVKYVNSKTMELSQEKAALILSDIKIKARDLISELDID